MATDVRKTEESFTDMETHKKNPGDRRKRKIDARLLLDEREMTELDEKVKESGYASRSLYLRKLIAGASVVRVDSAPIREYVFLIRNAANNINQVAKKVNSSGGVVESDVRRLKESVHLLKEQANKIANRLLEVL